MPREVARESSRTDVVQIVGDVKRREAEPARIVRMVIREGMLLVGIGALLGAVMAFGAAKVLSGVLFVAPFDPLSFALATGVLASAALLANAVPAWRASRVDPMVALRSA